MLEIGDLGLTPRQYAEVQDADPQLVEEWLVKVSEPGVSNPAAWFLTGLRSGESPEARHDSERARAIHLAENWVIRVGMLYDREQEILDALFVRGGKLHAYAGDVKLQKRMITLWARHRPEGEQVERDALARAEQNAATYKALHEKGGKDEPGDGQGEGRAA